MGPLSLEEQCRTLHIPDVDPEKLKVILETKKRALVGRYHPSSGAEPGGNNLTKATYLFDTVTQANRFGQDLAEEGIGYSMHPASDYNRLSTEEMDPAMGAIFSALSPE
jgi:hypothetical protein